jgi:hypothetical protein
MKKLICLALCILFAFSLTSCGEKDTSEEDVKALLQSYTEAMQRFDADALKELSANTDYSLIDQKLSILPEEFIEQLKAWAFGISCTVDSIEIDDISGTAVMHFKYHDATEAMREASKVYNDKVAILMGKDAVNGYLSGPGGGPRTSSSDKLDAEIDAFLLQCLTDAVETVGVTEVEKDLSVDIVKYQGEWKIKKLSMDIFNVLTSNAFILSQEE